jgi:hypothetical protein
VSKKWRFAKSSGYLMDPAQDLARLSCADVTTRL